MIFISGGVRSGKSSFAENLACDLAKQTGGNLQYIAAGQANDPEMEARIQRHQEDRKSSSLKWTSWEKPSRLAELSGVFGKNDIVLLDCLTTLLNNELFLTEDRWRDPAVQKQIDADILEGIIHIQRDCKAFIVVSNEVLNEPMGGNELVFIYGRLLGSLHQKMAEKAEKAFLIEAGIPLQMKGEPA
ncbi:bifunctional adenosylcobinamide kinase/adenosylcobinamide-phosphate guanylyltransferase [Bacillus sp. ISL-47]|uniref:bifunctional adenosylcobinamide kinase/adenosylcobinamide-phosphate guanylyltransferase n=1 Tax=Bacillus sp. ISL-47 TaxID=2819130 RepID=UPI001BEC1B18|nr:bifunctional adenosylcobinamide kinase/adenosylcobinamide-phosphate guanylyltransferase [Bacillus sp. ISL-47]MBT2710295.1 bifunctional adenosylcobinamide kinase/adenosylcobinamide-phosphate guanylyltransferase [Pseudomonas sp. ISL-84]